MLKTNLIHPDIVAALSRCGHGDRVLIADGNYPAERCAAPGAALIHLGLTAGVPTVTQVLGALQSAVNIEAAQVMRPDDGSSPEIFDEFRSMLGLELSGLGRREFYDICRADDVRLVISTGEKRVYANLLLTVGVA